jgi:lactoylglutathione lyase
MRYLHTRIRVSDMKRSIEFYTKILKLSISRQTVSPRGYPLVFLQANGCELELVQLPGAFQVPDDLFHIAFAVKDISSFKSMMPEGPIKSSSGLIGFISDPDGYEIELIQEIQRG